jgi:hypothetical protein
MVAQRAGVPERATGDLIFEISENGVQAWDVSCAISNRTFDI